MRHIVKTTNLLAVLTLSFSIASFSGCVNLEKKFPDIRTYALELPQRDHVTFDGAPASVRLSTFSSVPAFSDRYLTYRTGETAYEQDFYNQLMSAPARMVQDQFFTWMKASPLVSFILPTDAAQKADYVIEGKLLDLSGDYRRTAEPKAVFAIQFTVSKMESGNTRVLFQRIYDEEILIKQPSPKTLTEGWITGFEKIIQNFEMDFKDLINKA